MKHIELSGVGYGLMELLERFSGDEELLSSAIDLSITALCHRRDNVEINESYFKEGLRDFVALKGIGVTDDTYHHLVTWTHLHGQRIYSELQLKLQLEESSVCSVCFVFAICTPLRQVLYVYYEQPTVIDRLRRLFKPRKRAYA